MIMTNEELQKAIESSVSHCPFCGSENLEATTPDLDGLEATSIVTCSDCEAEWRETYRLSGVGVLSAPKSTEPAEGDLISSDHQHFYEFGGGFAFSVIKDGVERDWRVVAKEYMDNEQFWPNVWLVSDNGRMTLLSLDDAR
jgi:hypothetical protein